MAKKNCKHFNFITNAQIARLEDSGGFMAEMSIKCKDCNTPFKFLGLPMGLSLGGGAMVDPTETEVRIVIKPLNEGEKEKHKIMMGVQGFSIKKTN